MLYWVGVVSHGDAVFIDAVLCTRLFTCDALFTDDVLICLLTGLSPI